MMEEMKRFKEAHLDKLKREAGKGSTVCETTNSKSSSSKERREKYT